MPVFLHFTKCKINDHFSYLRPVANIPFLCENTNMNAKHAEETLSFYGNIMKHGSKCYFRAFSTSYSKGWYKVFSSIFSQQQINVFVSFLPGLLQTRRSHTAETILLWEMGLKESIWLSTRVFHFEEDCKIPILWLSPASVGLCCNYYFHSN